MKKYSAEFANLAFLIKRRFGVTPAAVARCKCVMGDLKQCTTRDILEASWDSDLAKLQYQRGY